MLSNTTHKIGPDTSPDPRTHTPDNPFCFKPACSCHEDQAQIAKLLQFIIGGLLTIPEAAAIVQGKAI